jgi:hypothetical protein
MRDVVFVQASNQVVAIRHACDGCADIFDLLQEVERPGQLGIYR